MTLFSRLSSLLLMIGFSCQLSACGQKGPLFMPAKPPVNSTPYPVTIPPTTSVTDNDSNQEKNN